MICSSEEINYVFKHQTPSGAYELDTREVRQMLETVTIDNPEIRLFLKEMFQDNLEQIQISE